MFPHLDCIDDLQKISDLRQPANWFVFEYPVAAAVHDKQHEVFFSLYFMSP